MYLLLVIMLMLMLAHFLNVIDNVNSLKDKTHINGELRKTFLKVKTREKIHDFIIINLLL